jgi:hypothetical protein
VWLGLLEHLDGGYTVGFERYTADGDLSPFRWPPTTGSSTTIRIQAAVAPRGKSLRAMSTKPMTQTTISGRRMNTQTAVDTANIHMGTGSPQVRMVADPRILFRQGQRYAFGTWGRTPEEMPGIRHEITARA